MYLYVKLYSLIDNILLSMFNSIFLLNNIMLLFNLEHSNLNFSVRNLNKASLCML
jgi:hypothetical protein